MRYDLVVVGGPAGAAAAKAVVEEGLPTLLIEKKAIPEVIHAEPGILVPPPVFGAYKHGRL